MRLKTEGYRAHNPRWAWLPLSGEGAALHGGRFNPRGTAALYLGLSLLTAVKEANQGFAFKIQPTLICSYDIDCDDLEDLREKATLDRLDVTSADLACAWLAIAAAGEEPPTWALARRLIGAGTAGLIAPSYAPGADASDANLILWRWGPDLPHSVRVHDPNGRLAHNDQPWRS